jgi:hypothetical protein
LAARSLRPPTCSTRQATTAAAAAPATSLTAPPTDATTAASAAPRQAPPSAWAAFWLLPSCLRPSWVR